MRAGVYAALFMGVVLIILPARLLSWAGVTRPAAVGDPPRRLVVRGPYQFVRNPMYIGAGFALAGAALFYHSTAFLGYTALFVLVAHLFVVWYEEPTLRQTFGADYETYSRRVHRWWPRLGAQSS